MPETWPAIFSWLWLAWLLTKRALELVVLAGCLFVLPTDRLEHFVAAAAAVVWLAVRHQTIAGEMLNRGRMQLFLQLARTALALFERTAPADEATLDEDFRHLQYHHVGIGNSAVLSPKYESLRKPVSVRALRREVEQAWFDSLMGFHRNTTYMVTEGVCSWCRIAVVIWAILAQLTS